MTAIVNRRSAIYNSRVMLSVVIITFNEEANLPRTLKSVEGLVRDLNGEIIVVDSGSTDHTVEIARSFGAKVFVEEWKGFARQKNSAIEKASGEWVLSLDGDEEVSPELSKEIKEIFTLQPGVLLQKLAPGGYDAWIERVDHEQLVVTLEDQREGPLAGAEIPRKNLFLGRWIRRGGFYPDRKLRLFRLGLAQFEARLVHEDAHTTGFTLYLKGALIHHAYPTLSSYIEHMNRYSSFGAEMVGPRGFSFIDIFIRPRLTFFYNYFLRLGFLDGREGFLLHLYHSVYVSWKYAKAWEMKKKVSEVSEVSEVVKPKQKDRTES